MVDELKNIPVNESVIPDGCLDFLEASNFLCSAIEEDFDEIMEACGSGSDAPEVTDGEGDGKDVATSEAASLESITESVKEAIVNKAKEAWGGIKGLFDKLIVWIKDQVAKFKQKIAGNVEKKWTKSNFKSDKKLGRFHPAAQLQNTKWIDACFSSYDKKAAATAKQGENANVENIPTKVLSAFGVSGSNVTVNEMRKKMKSAMLGAEVAINGGNVDSKKEEIIKVLKGDQINYIKTQYNASRSKMNAFINDTKKWEKAAKVAGDKEAQGELKARINVAKRTIQVLSTGVGAVCDAVRQQYREALGIALKVVGKAEKEDKKKEAEKPEGTSEAVEIFAW